MSSSRPFGPVPLFDRPFLTGTVSAPPVISSKYAVQHEPPSYIATAMPDFTNFDFKPAEFSFEELTQVDFDLLRREFRYDNLWYESARTHVYTTDQVEEFLQKEDQKEFPGIRFVLNCDMSITFASDSNPSKNIPAHGQMTNGNNLSVISGINKRRVEDNCLIIEGTDNQAGGFRGNFQKLQFFFIALFKTKAFQEGKIALDETKDFILTNIAAGSERYFITVEKLKLQIETLASKYALTILSPKKLAEYAAVKPQADMLEVPNGMEAQEFINQHFAENSCSSPSPNLSPSTSTQLIDDFLKKYDTPEYNSLGKRPPPTPRKTYYRNASPETPIKSTSLRPAGFSFKFSSPTSSAPASLFIYGPPEATHTMKESEDGSPAKKVKQ